MGMQDHARWLTISDGTLTATLTVYEQLQFSQTYETLGGALVTRMLDGSAVKQTNWQKLRTTISASGGVPPGIADLDYTLSLTIMCAVPRAITRPTNSFTTIPPHRTDGAYAPALKYLIEGFWVDNPGTETPEAYMLVYYPLLSGFAEPPHESTNPDTLLPISWSLTLEEM